jgi:hypothetical protein
MLPRASNGCGAKSLKGKRWRAPLVPHCLNRKMRTKWKVSVRIDYSVLQRRKGRRVERTKRNRVVKLCKR